jgi:hypothetical protein
MAGENGGRVASPNPTKWRGGGTLRRWVLVKSINPNLHVNPVGMVHVVATDFNPVALNDRNKKLTNNEYTIFNNQCFRSELFCSIPLWGGLGWGFKEKQPMVKVGVRQS